MKRHRPILCRLGFHRWQKLHRFRKGWAESPRGYTWDYYPMKDCARCGIVRHRHGDDDESYPFGPKYERR